MTGATKISRKSKKIKSELQEIIEDVQFKDVSKDHEIFMEVAREVAQEKTGWNIPITETPKYFDFNLSYELTGYKPIDSTRGLDFNPEWFTEASRTFLRTGHYTQFARNSKAYADFWDQEYKRCQNGMTINGYTITGDHYFFLNYYQLQNIANVEKAGTSRMWTFPSFFVAQYIFFHYLELAKVLKKNAVLMKARGVGFSEINASILANAYNCRKGSRNMIAAHASQQLDPTIDKVWKALNWINDNTDGGFFKLRQACDTQYVKRASYYKVENGQKIETGWMSQIQGVIANDPNKLRGERIDLLIMEESGSWPSLTTAFIQAQALLNIQGHRFGITIVGGTGGDNGAGLEGLREMYYSPDVFDVLPFKHNNTATEEYTLSGFFLPASWIINKPEYIDNRGFTDPIKGKEYHMKLRERYAVIPQKLLEYSAENCLTAEEAFSREGNNNFDRIILADQLAAIRVTKQCPEIQTGTLSYIYNKGGDRTLNNVTGYKWELNSTGKVKILEHPIWSTEYNNQQASFKEYFESIGESYEEQVYDSQMNNLYVAGIDSIDIGMEETSENTDNPSKFCIIIFKRAFGISDPIPVAYYMDRPEHIRDAYKIAMCLVTYYRAIVNIEATRMNLYAWAREHGYQKYFMMRPIATYPDPSKIGRRTPGTPATASIIAHQLALIGAYIEDYGHHIWFEELLDELTRYSIEFKTHFDMVAAFGMVMLANEELGAVPATKVINYNENKQEIIGYYYDDDGRKRFGVIPTRESRSLVSIDANSGFIGSSDPRRWGY